MWFAPFLIGLAGSLHCVGMCVPLSSLVSNVGHNALGKRLLYNGGRIITYGVLGAFISYIGGFAALLGVQIWVSLLVGVLLLLVGLMGIQVTPPAFLSRFLGSLSSFLKARFSVLLGMKSIYGVFGMGLINGLLPCGLTWVALGYCVTLQWPLDGFIAMILFGLGTLPAMLGFTTLLNQFSIKFKVSFRKLQTVLLICSGCILIARTVTASWHPTASAQEVTICGINEPKVK